MNNPRVIKTNIGDLIVESVTVAEKCQRFEHRNEFGEVDRIEGVGHSVEIIIRLKGYGLFTEDSVRGLLEDQLALENE
jgi:hypothetical protein